MNLKSCEGDHILSSFSWLKSSNWSVPKRDEVALGIVGIQVSKKYGKELQRLFKNQMFKPMKHNISSYNKRMINI